MRAFSKKAEGFFGMLMKDHREAIDWLWFTGFIGWLNVASEF